MVGAWPEAGVDLGGDHPVQSSLRGLHVSPITSSLVWECTDPARVPQGSGFLGSLEGWACPLSSLQPSPWGALVSG